MSTRSDRPECWTPEIVASKEQVITACRHLLRYSEQQEIPGHLILLRDDKVILAIISEVFKAVAELETWERRYGMEAKP